MSSSRTVRSMRSLPSLRKSLHTSSAAPTPSHLLSSQRETMRTHYTSMTVNNLKHECRQRGLKLTGKKIDLVDRIVGFEQAKTFSSSSQSQATLASIESKMSSLSLNLPPTSKQAAVSRAFSTTPIVDEPASVVDYHLPTVAEPNTTSHPVTKIPVGPESEGTQIFSDLSKKKINADTGASAGDVHVVDNNSSKISHMNVDLGDAEPHYDEERFGHTPQYNIPSKDKPFLFGLGAAIAVWWGSQYITDDFTEEH